eukprot:1068839-Pelagomonas_calceolata.AAC.2
MKWAMCSDACFHLHGWQRGPSTGQCKAIRVHVYVWMRGLSLARKGGSCLGNNCPRRGEKYC